MLTHIMWFILLLNFCAKKMYKLGCKFVFEEKILWFYSKSFKPFSFLTLWKLRHSYRLTLPIFSLQPAISRKQKWTHSHILPYFIKALIHTYIHKDSLLSRYHHRFPAFSLSFSLSLYLYLSLFMFTFYQVVKISL